MIRVKFIVILSQIEEQLPPPPTEQMPPVGSEQIILSNLEFVEYLITVKINSLFYRKVYFKDNGMAHGSGSSFDRSCSTNKEVVGNQWSGNHTQFTASGIVRRRLTYQRPNG